SSWSCTRRDRPARGDRQEGVQREDRILPRTSAFRPGPCFSASGVPGFPGSPPPHCPWLWGGGSLPFELAPRAGPRDNRGHDKAETAPAADSRAARLGGRRPAGGLALAASQARGDGRELPPGPSGHEPAGGGGHPRAATRNVGPWPWRVATFALVGPGWE